MEFRFETIHVASVLQKKCPGKRALRSKSVVREEYSAGTLLQCTYIYCGCGKRKNFNYNT